MVRVACSELGCTTPEEFATAIGRVRDSGKKVTLQAVFEELQTMHGKSNEALQRACWVVESPRQNLLLGLWGNCMANFLALPIAGNTLPTHSLYSRLCLTSSLRTFLKMAQDLALPNLERALGTYPATTTQTESPTPLAPGLTPPSLLQLRMCVVPQSLIDSKIPALSLGVERDGKFVPFKNRIELNGFLRDTFLEWADMVGQPISEHTRESLYSTATEQWVNIFETALLGKTLSDQQLVINGMACYPIVGGVPITLEKATIVSSKGVSLGLPEDTSKAVRQFLQWTHEARERFGDSNELSLVAHDSGHGFRILPNHPTIRETLGRTGDPIAEIEATVQAQMTEEKHPVTESLEKLSEIIHQYSLELAPQLKWNPEEIFESMVQTIKDLSSGVEDGECTYMEFLENVAEALAQSLAPYYSILDIASLSKLQNLLLIRSLAALLGPAWKNHFIYFADTNHRTFIAGKSQAMNYVFWFDPTTSSWDIASIPESGTLAAAIPFGYLGRNAFFRSLTAFPSGGPLIREAHQKTLLQLDRKTNSTMQKLEREFANAWHSLEQETAQLKSTDRSVVVEELSALLDVEIPEGTQQHDYPPLEHAPQPWKDAFERCLEVRQRYERTVEESALKYEAAGAEFRITPLSTSTPLPHLRSSEEEFRHAVRDLVNQPEPMTS